MKILIAAAMAIFASTAAFAGNLDNNGLGKGAYGSLKLGGATATSDFDNRGSTGLYDVAVGYDLGAVRVELANTGFQGGKSTIGTVNGQMVNFNTYAEPYTFNGITPYLTAGVGYAWLNGTGIQAVDNRDSGWVGNLGAGATYTINANWALDAGYRYYQTLERVSVRANDGTTANEFRTHTYTLGTRYSF